MKGLAYPPVVSQGWWRRREKLRRTACLPGLLALGLAGLGAQAPSWTSVWDGVYTDAQAARGRQTYEAYCASCHGGQLGGGGTARALAGPRFYQDWGEDTLNSLFTITRSTMPSGGAGILDDATYLDIVAYMLKANAYPAGAAELTLETVERVRVVGKEGPRPVPNFALVAVVGCLTRTSTGAWTLEGSTEPVRTRNPDPSPEADRAKLAATAVGPARFELMDVYSAGNGHDGHRMEVKGLLIRGKPDRINITAMQMVASDCPH